MKRFLTGAVITASLLSGAAAIAQGPPVPGAPPAGGFEDGATTTTTTTTTDVDAGYGYAATGWNPSLLLAASGALGAGSLALKGFLRKRANG